jgi:hypothetical protein
MIRLELDARYCDELVDFDPGSEDDETYSCEVVVEVVATIGPAVEDNVTVVLVLPTGEDDTVVKVVEGPMFDEGGGGRPVNTKKLVDVVVELSGWLLDDEGSGRPGVNTK